ncbi:MAG: ABC transporter permease [Candidatus Thermofonsia Clade 1 bacterium]|uniref:ABC transporter permease n=1 Tax=Candidatus Thermofonsia Clade 1 bacterium TaxID=2364210 RepID=A0A2M8P0Y4_9CHLR|nr:MAG: ABC transporter permease [Candidatus Thermofonsia Clade 1 bacterium]
MESVLSSIFSATYLAAILRISTPLLLPALAALISVKAGVINIGLEGIMLIAAFTGATVGGVLQNALIGALAGLSAAILTALILAVFHLSLKGDLILGGIAINILGSAVTVALGYQLGGARAGGLSLPPISLPDLDLPFLRSVPLIGETLYTAIGRQNILTWGALLSAFGVAFLLYRLPFGVHLRAVGENESAAASVGIQVQRTRYAALLLSGLLAGLGGVYMSMGYLNSFSRDMTAGRGYIALVIPALGGYTPFGTLIAALLFGAFAALETRLGSFDVPSQLPQMIPYLATLIALTLYAWRRRRAAQTAP